MNVNKKSKDFFIWEGIFNDFKKAQNFADGFGFSGDTYNTRAYDAAKECLISLDKKVPIPFFHKQRSVILPPVAAMLLNQKSKIDIFDDLRDTLAFNIAGMIIIIL